MASGRVGGLMRGDHSEMSNCPLSPLLSLSMFLGSRQKVSGERAQGGGGSRKKQKNPLLLEGEVWQPASMERVGCSKETPDNRWEWSLLLLQLGHECHLVNPLSSYPGLGFRPQT